MKHSEARKRREMIHQMMGEGKTVDQILERFKEVSPLTVKGVMYSFGYSAVRMNKKGIKPFVVLRKLREGMKQVDIALEMGVTRQYISWISKMAEQEGLL